MDRFASRMSYMQASADVTRHLFESMTDPSIISFSGGAPAKEALPVEALRDIAYDVLTRDGRGTEALQYGRPFGLTDLRQAAIDHLLKPKGIAAELSNVLVCGGGMEGLYLVGQAFLDPGDVVLVESPTFVQSVQTFELTKARCVSCATDDEGLDLADTEAKIKEYSPKFLYVIPTFQNPTGKTSSLKRRRELAELANRYDLIIVEDDPYEDMRYSGERIPPVKTFDKKGDFIYCNSFSKIFSPGSRLGYVCADAKIISKLYDVKTASNSHTGMISQVLCAEFFKRGLFEAHLKKICDIHRERRDVMMECAKTMLPEGSKYIYPDGGLFTWVELPGGLDSTSLVAEAAERKVAFMPGEKFFTFGRPIRKNCMRLSFGSQTPDNIREGMARLTELIQTKLRLAQKASL